MRAPAPDPTTAAITALIAERDQLRVENLRLSAVLAEARPDVESVLAVGACGSGATVLPALQPSAKKNAWNLLVSAASSITFVRTVLPTALAVEPDGFHVRLDVVDRDTGEEVTLAFRWDFPPLLLSREQALDWIYACVREAWVHELNEALFVDGKRRRDLHNASGQTISPPDDAVEAAKRAVDAFKEQLCSLLEGHHPSWCRNRP